ncbi:MAG: hypothetical protein ACLSE6_04080 [Alphaproteobacteria bacterium]
MANVYNKGGITDAIREEIVNRFRKLNINIPYPQLVVHLLKDS